MTEQQLAAMKQALSVIKNSQDYKMGRASTVEAAEDISTAIEQAEIYEDEKFKPDWMNYQEGFAAGVLEGREQMKQAAAPVQEPIELHVLHSHIAGALFDFMGWLTSREKRLTLSSTDEAGPAVEAITEFAKMRGLSLQDAQVEHWQAILTTPPASTRTATREEKISRPGVYEVQDTETRYKDVIEGVRKVWDEHRVKRAEEAFESAKQREWVGLTNEELIDLTAIYSGAPLYCAIEQRLKEKNHE